MRVHELAKQLDIPSKELVAKLKALGADVKSHMSSVDEAAIALLDAKGEAPAETEQPEAAPAKETAAPPEEQKSEEQAPKEKEAPAELPASEEEPGEPGEGPSAAPVNDTPVLKMKGAIIVKQLAAKLGTRPNRLIAELMRMNVLASINERIDLEIAKKIAVRHGFTLEHEKKSEPQKPVMKPKPDEVEEEDNPEDLLPRPPVVTFLGHVDHGKTSLLDKIRNTGVAQGESGGITQHIGAYTIEVGGQKITFLDTPGHAAFTAMRARGADLTDIAVIIIAADDGIMPQTKEAIRHAKAAEVCMMVAINKIDMPTANVDRVKQQLQVDGLTTEDWGGEVISADVSAQTGEGIDHLLEMILLQADMLELKANPNRRATGFVVEAQLEQGMGPTANLLVTKGTLNVGDVVLCGQHSGRIRALINDHGAKIKSVGPATPVKCLGLSGVPEAGANFRVYVNEKAARIAAAEEQARIKDGQLVHTRKASLDSLFEQIEADQKLELKVIIKADTQGSIEAITHSLREIKSDKVSLNILLGDTGNITVNDVMLASASNAVILGFHIGNESGVPAVAKHEGVEIRLHQVIYELIEQVEEAMTGLLAPKLEERLRGEAQIRQVFNIGKKGNIAGCLVTGGIIRPAFRARLKRGEDILYEGKITTLKHFQDEVAEVREAQECGVRLDNYTAIEEGDVIEFYEVEAVKQAL
jgi:translation initiation factor IF-2